MTRQQAQRRIGAWVRFKDNHDPRGHLTTARIQEVVNDDDVILRLPGKNNTQKAKLRDVKCWHSRDAEAGIKDDDIAPAAAAEGLDLTKTRKMVGRALIKNATMVTQKLDPTHINKLAIVHTISQENTVQNIDGAMSQWLEKLKDAKTDLQTAEQMLADERQQHATRCDEAKRTYEQVCRDSARHIEEAEKVVEQSKRAYAATASAVREKKAELDRLLEEALNFMDAADKSGGNVRGGMVDISADGGL